MKPTAKEHVEAELPRLKTKVAKMQEEAARMKRSNFRLVLGAFIAVPICGGLFGLFEGLGKTNDWVLEYYRWITGGIYLVGAVIWAAVVFLPWHRDQPKAPKAGQPSPGP